MRHYKAADGYRFLMGQVGRFALFLGVLVAAALMVFWLFLADYQSSLPKNLAEQVFNAYRTGDVKTIGEYSVNLPEPLEDSTLFAKYYSDHADLDSLYFYPGSANKPDQLCYEFVLGSDPIASLTLQKNGQTSLFGFPRYEIVAITGYPLTSYSITAPSDAMVFVNGKLLSERYRTDEQTTLNNFSPLSGTVFQTKTYEITDFTYIEDLGAFTMDGCECIATWSEDLHSVVVEKRMSNEMQAEIFTFAERFSEAYSIFATKRSGARDPVTQLLQPGTPFHKALLLYNNEWGEIYTTHRYDNRVIDRFVRYSPTEFSCNIRFDYVIQPRGGLEKTYPYSMTYYLTNRSGQLALVDMQAQ